MLYSKFPGRRLNAQALKGGLPEEGGGGGGCREETRAGMWTVGRVTQGRSKEKSCAVARTGRWNPPSAACPPRTARCPLKQWAGQAGEPGLHKIPPRGPQLPGIGANSECAPSMHSLSHALSICIFLGERSTALIRSSECTMGTLHWVPQKGSSLG